jgi:hypothetical protein
MATVGPAQGTTAARSNEIFLKNNNIFIINTGNSRFKSGKFPPPPPGLKFPLIPVLIISCCLIPHGPLYCPPIRAGPRAVRTVPRHQAPRVRGPRALPCHAHLRGRGCGPGPTACGEEVKTKV